MILDNFGLPAVYTHTQFSSLTAWGNTQGLTTKHQALCWPRLSLLSPLPRVAAGARTLWPWAESKDSRECSEAHTCMYTHETEI